MCQKGNIISMSRNEQHTFLDQNNDLDNLDWKGMRSNTYGSVACTGLYCTRVLSALVHSNTKDKSDIFAAKPTLSLHQWTCVRGN
jgi:hypothetical protein